MNKYGIFYGIGVGPGDPELITLKAKYVLEKMRYVFIPISGKEKKSIAYSIAQMFIPPETKIEELIFPMTTEQITCEKAWEENAIRIASILEKGNDVAFITLGDPMTYSTYGYLLRKIKSRYPQVQSITIPGIPSYSAVAASTNLTLTQGSEVLTLLPSNNDNEKIKKLLSLSNTIIFLKHHKKTKELFKILEEMDLADKAIYVSRYGFKEQIITPHPTQDLLEKTDYLSLLIVKKSSE